MTEHNFKIKFGKSWGKYSRVLRETAPRVIEAFKGTSLEENMDGFYKWAIPGKGESSFTFFLRNGDIAYKPCSRRQKGEFFLNGIILGFGLFLGKIPFLGRKIGTHNLSTELFIGQESSAYVSEEGVEKNPKIGNDRFYSIVSNAAKPMDLDIDVGFESGRNYFYQINVFDDSLLYAAKRTHEIIQKAKENMGQENEN